MSVTLHLLFLFCVCLATVAQCLTGFAFGLILLGLVAMLHLAPLADVAIAVSVLTLINAAITLKLPFRADMVRPLLSSSFVGVLIGTSLLTWMSGSWILWLRLLLGGVILLCSLMLVLQARPRAACSGKRSFWIAGGLCGVLNGLFASGGPPVVYHLYRQPLGFEVIRNTLILVLAANAAMRLVMVALQGDLTANAWLLSGEALPVVLLISWLLRRYPPPLSLRSIRWIVFVLLVIAGGSLLMESMTLLLA